MNDFDGLDEPVLVAPIGKKRKPSKSNHNREIVKKMRHSGGGKVSVVVCTHTAAQNHGFCHANKLSPDDIAMNFAKFYQGGNKVQQDEQLLLLMSVGKTQRRQKKVDDENSRKDRNVSVKYSLLTHDHPNKLPVCKATFLSILGECFYTQSDEFM